MSAALVTGAGTRLGRAMALGLAEAGFDIAVHYNASETDAREVASLIVKKGRRAGLVKADLSKESETADLIAAAVQRTDQPGAARHFGCYAVHFIGGLRNNVASG